MLQSSIAKHRFNSHRVSANIDPDLSIQQSALNSSKKKQVRWDNDLLEQVKEVPRYIRIPQTELDMEEFELFDEYCESLPSFTVKLQYIANQKLHRIDELLNYIDVSLRDERFYLYGSTAPEPETLYEFLDHLRKIIKLREARLARETDFKNIAKRFGLVPKRLTPSSGSDQAQWLRTVNIKIGRRMMRAVSLWPRNPTHFFWFYPSFRQSPFVPSQIIRPAVRNVAECTV